MPESTRTRKWLKGWTGSDADGASRLPRHPLLLRPRRRPGLLDEEDRERSKPTGIASRLLHDNHSRTLIDNGSRRGLETTTLRINSARLAGVNFIPLSEKIASMAGEMILKNNDLP